VRDQNGERDFIRFLKTHPKGDFPMDNLITTSLMLLGRKARDKVTGFEGIVMTIGFDATGCVQAILNPPIKDGKLAEQGWFDVKRLELGDAVLPVPNFGQLAEAGGDIYKPTR
jgi:hypothetical protein